MVQEAAGAQLLLIRELLAVDAYTPAALFSDIQLIEGYWKNFQLFGSPARNFQARTGSNLS